eukprot:CAMPEP_0185727486 /NCGR_PEP_ID=MMETSP1171-20130828/3161_1 /TAXON_ID=374046 /ORGANISM="Helicotheca tamensis, Strain CCMP826" /LENGTH=396 /DNA_ID=CAMNT_0028396065 /DNA_START=196 /DNA_END=1386 /DNA_ORIENTATION=-
MLTQRTVSESKGKDMNVAPRHAPTCGKSLFSRGLFLARRVFRSRLHCTLLALVTLLGLRNLELQNSLYKTKINASSPDPVGGFKNKIRPRSPEPVWVLAYPNSGTTYTLALMEQVTNYSMATNYMGDVLQPVPDIPLYEDLPEGPFWRGPSIKPLPETTVLVKTHCAGYKEHHKEDAHKIYSLTVETFIRECGRTTIYGDPSKRLVNSRERQQRDGYYDSSEVQKALHIFRNPFDNLVARFNNYHFKKSRGSHRVRYEKNREGFRAFCHDRNADFDEKYRDIEMTNVVKELAKRTICYDNAMAYVLWHNRAFETRDRMKLNTLQFRYEDYETKFGETLPRLLKFLDLPERGTPLEFHAGHHYFDYYTQEDRENIKALVKELASERTWEAIRGYFGE